MENMKALGEYINKKLNKKIDFKGIKTHPVYRENLFSYNGEDYLVSGKKVELQNLILTISSRKPEDYPAKLGKKYTHKKYIKAKEKRIEEIRVGNKSFFLIVL